MDVPRLQCDCNDAWKDRGREVYLHEDVQDLNSNAWQCINQYINDLAKVGGGCEFKPRSIMSREDWLSLITLPSTIGQLKSVVSFEIYGSAITRLPPEIGQLTFMKSFTPYTSYRLHWFPYEITRCTNLSSSTVSTRAIYGNFKHRNPFPDLRKQTYFLQNIRPTVCSVCESPFAGVCITRWVSLLVATDVLPLLVFACSPACIKKIPAPAENHVSTIHRGGRSIEQPPGEFSM